MLITIENTRMHHALRDFADSLADRQLAYYASDLLGLKGCKGMDELNRAVKRATEVCRHLHLPLHENFKVVYRAQQGQVVQDWRLSPMACLLTVINSDATSDVVARLQVEMVKRMLQQQP